MFGANLIVLALLGQPPEPSRDAAALVEKLGSAAAAEREASKSLESLGGKASPALRAASKSKDPEVRKRARALINKIDGNVLIQESSIRLDFKDATLDEVVKSLSKQAGFEVGLAQQGPQLEARRVTLRESQPVPFWKAIDRLCEVGQLARQYQGMTPRGPGVSQPRLVLSYQPEPSTQPGYNHGPFHFDIVSLSYQSQVSFNRPARMRAPQRIVQGPDGVARKVAAPPAARRPPAPRGRERRRTRDWPRSGSSSSESSCRSSPSRACRSARRALSSSSKPLTNWGNRSCPPRGTMGESLAGRS